MVDESSPTKAQTPTSGTVTELAESTNSISSSNDLDLEKGKYPPVFTTPPPAPPNPERFRDISFLGPITLHRTFIILTVVGFGALFYYIQQWIFPATDPDPNAWRGWPYVSIIWLISLPTAVATFIGNLWFRYNTKLDEISPTKHNVAFRIVSRGLNAECLLETIRRCHEEMYRNPMFPYVIELVTDADAFEAPQQPDVIQLKVPISYQTPAGSLFKARALNYACEHSTVPPTTWIVHLDEETQPTSSGIKGIAAMIEECERTGDINRIGQGSILYNRAFEKHPFLTLVDMRRTGDDFGQFYLQHRLGISLFGLHGAFIVCRQDAEAKIGFDLGPDGSITEDAWWVLLAMKEGYRTKWVDGYLEEQSTQSIVDLLKQRRRWYYGLTKVMFKCPVSIKYRFVMGWSISTWLIIPMLMPLQIAVVVVLVTLRLPLPFAIRILTNFILSMTLIVYFTGLISNMAEHEMAWWKRPFWIVGMFIALPFGLVLEIASVVMAFFAPCSTGGKGFHVVEKSAVAETKDVSSSDSRSADDIVEGRVFV